MENTNTGVKVGENLAQTSSDSSVDPFTGENINTKWSALLFWPIKLILTVLADKTDPKLDLKLLFQDNWIQLLLKY